MRNTVIGLAAAAAIITAGSTLNASAHGMSYGSYNGRQGEYGRGEYGGNLNAVDILAGNLVAVSTVGSLNAMDTRAGSLVAANIPAVNTAEASMVNVEGMASIATELDRQRYTLARSSPAAMPESR
jgi:hypothetical protein